MILIRIAFNNRGYIENMFTNDLWNIYFIVNANFSLQLNPNNYEVIQICDKRYLNKNVNAILFVVNSYKASLEYYIVLVLLVYAYFSKWLKLN